MRPKAVFHEDQPYLSWIIAKKLSPNATNDQYGAQVQAVGFSLKIAIVMAFAADLNLYRFKEKNYGLQWDKYKQIKDFKIRALKSTTRIRGLGVR
jgi:hypothetical protein